MRILITILMVLLLGGNLFGADFKGMSLMGVRLGVGHFSDNTPDEKYINYTITADQNGFFTELFYSWNFMNELSLDVGLGVVNRGQFRWQIPEGSFFGTINIYPITVGIKFRPLASMVSKHYQPYIAGGASVIVGRAVIEGGSVYDPYAFVDSPDKTQTDIGWWIGGGFESFISNTIMITSSFKYQEVKFGNTVGGFSDYTGYQISFGAGYIFSKAK